MSRIGKKPIEIPEGVTVNIENGEVLVKGPKGELKIKISEGVSIKDNCVVVSIEKDKALWGLTRSLIFNMIEGVSKGYEKRLKLEGSGYTVTADGKGLLLKVGFSHPVKIKEIPEIELKAEKNIISISGCNKQQVGQVAADIRKIRPPEPYKGKGIRYEDEIVRRKEGKKAITAE